MPQQHFSVISPQLDAELLNQMLPLHALAWIQWCDSASSCTGVDPVV